MVDKREIESGQEGVFDERWGCNEESKKDLIVLFSKQNGHYKFH